MNSTGARPEPYLAWCGGIICIVMAVAALAVIAVSNGWLQQGSLPAVAAAQSVEVAPAAADRTSCAEFGTSDLRSPQEGLWFQRNCAGVPAPVLAENAAKCNRTSLDAGEFALIAPGLYVFRQTQASTAYLWYSSAENCFDLVSARVVTAVCADQTVSFDWNTTCSGHGGVLARINGR